MSNRPLSSRRPSSPHPSGSRQSEQEPPARALHDQAHSGRPADEGAEVDVLLELLANFPDSVVVGFRPDGAHVDLHVAPLPPDERTGAAGLFGMQAPEDWSAVGVAIAGRARHSETREVVGSGANAAVVVTRTGRCASWMRVDGLPGAHHDDGTERERELDDGLDGPGGPGRMTGGERTDGGAEGLAVDGLHRMLGLPVPGAPPTPARLAVAIWAHQILELLFARGTVTWREALEVHPGEPGTGPVAPSVEMLVEATVRSTEGFRWQDMHARAAAGAITVHELSAAEAAWMDTTMFARWVAGAMPDPSLAVGVLESHRCRSVANGLRNVVAGVDALGAGERRVTPE